MQNSLTKYSLVYIASRTTMWLRTVRGLDGGGTRGGIDYRFSAWRRARLQTRHPAIRRRDTSLSRPSRAPLITKSVPAYVRLCAIVRMLHIRRTSQIRRPDAALAHLGRSSLRLLPTVLHIPVEDSRHIHLGGGDLVAQEAHVVDRRLERRFRVR